MMQRIRLPAHSIPAHKAVKTPAKRLGGEKEPAKKPIIPPKIVDNVPTYGPRIMPIIGAAIAAAVIALPGKPIIGEIGKEPRTAYNAAEQAVKAAFLAGDFHSIDMLAPYSITRLSDRLSFLLKIE
jgi:hypothetical protein